MLIFLSDVGFNPDYGMSSLFSIKFIPDFGQKVRSWWSRVKASQEGDHVNVIIQNHIMKFQ